MFVEICSTLAANIVLLFWDVRCFGAGIDCCSSQQIFCFHFPQSSKRIVYKRRTLRNWATHSSKRQRKASEKHKFKKKNFLFFFLIVDVSCFVKETVLQCRDNSEIIHRNYTKFFHSNSSKLKVYNAKRSLFGTFITQRKNKKREKKNFFIYNTKQNKSLPEREKLPLTVRITILNDQISIDCDIVKFEASPVIDITALTRSSFKRLPQCFK